MSNSTMIAPTVPLCVRENENQTWHTVYAIRYAYGETAFLVRADEDGSPRWLVDVEIAEGTANDLNHQGNVDRF